MNGESSARNSGVNGLLIGRVSAPPWAKPRVQPIPSVNGLLIGPGECAGKEKAYAWSDGDVSMAS